MCSDATTAVRLYGLLLSLCALITVEICAQGAHSWAPERAVCGDVVIYLVCSVRLRTASPAGNCFLACSGKYTAVLRLPGGGRLLSRSLGCAATPTLTEGTAVLFTAHRVRARGYGPRGAAVPRGPPSTGRRSASAPARSITSTSALPAQAMDAMLALATAVAWRTVAGTVGCVVAECPDTRQRGSPGLELYCAYR